ncbi:MAG: protoporphyrinogen oxidase [Elusimicrobia bacterium]|nr:protoporphyrinogen oxidase [Elusimicrobiota bacterium]
MSTQPKTILIVGAGITGLSAAYTLEKAGIPYLLLESSRRLGGKIYTDSEGPFPIETGPDSFITAKPQAYDLCRELGLEADLLGTNTESKTVYLLSRGKLRPIPEGMSFMIPTQIWPFLWTDILSLQAKLKILKDLFLPRGQEGDDETVAQFFERRMGSEIISSLIEPFLSGVYAGSTQELSVRSSLPQIYNLERKYRSLILGMLKQRNSPPDKNAKETPFMTLKNGLGTLAYTLASRLKPANILLGTRAKFLARIENGYRMTLEDGRTLEAQSILLTAPAYESARILLTLDSQLSDLLNAIPYVSSATVTFGFRKKEILHPLKGFGFLVPRSEGKTILGATFTSTKFPGRTPDEYTVIRCFIGGHGREEILQKEDHEIFAAVLKNIQAILGISSSPFLKKIYRWPKGNPQYTVGHEGRLKAIEERLTQHPGVFLTGAAFRGIGIPDCIRQGQETAQKIISSMFEVSRLRT